MRYFGLVDRRFLSANRCAVSGGMVWTDRVAIAEAGRAELLLAAAAVVAVSESNGSALAERVVAVLLDVAAELRDVAAQRGGSL